MRFKKGDYVKVRKWKDMENEFGTNAFGDIKYNCSFVPEMKYLCGRILSISDVLDHSYRVRSSSSENRIIYKFSDDMLELSTYSKEEFERQESTR